MGFIGRFQRSRRGVWDFFLNLNLNLREFGRGFGNCGDWMDGI